MLTDYFEAYARDHKAYKGGSWCYEDGLIYRGLELLHRSTGDARWFDHVKRLVDVQIEEGPKLSNFEPNDYNIDNIMAGRALLYLYDETGDKNYLDTAALLIDQLATHPRTKTGVYWHKLRYPWQVWLDGLYMGVPFQIGYAQRTGQDTLIEDALTQVSTALDMTYVPETQLYAHAMDEARKQRWADPVTGHSTAHWARALGWLAMALSDIAELVGLERFEPLAERTRALFDRIMALRIKDGLWLQVIDQPDLEGNYEESSASAMFVYAFLKAKALGLWNGEIDGLYDTLLRNTVRTNDAGKLEMCNMCEVAGLGMFEGRYRDGTAAYYVSEVVVSDDAKGVGPLMMGTAIA